MRVMPVLCSLLLGSIFSTTSAHATWGYDQSLIRTIDSGQIEGVSDHHNSQAFKGIPYAAAPVGELRWRAPQAPQAWDGIRDASQFSSICPQAGTFWGDKDPTTFGTIIGNEDCLYLNVWRPNNPTKNLPVFLWIHGGANTRGSGSFETYNGASLANKANAIVVTINYRLGGLGWISNSAFDNGDPSDRSGNYALLDMIKSLEWVQNNIREFGGTPNKVTIAGNSSGCSAVWGLLQSPLAENLFQRAICSGGTPGSMDATTGQLLSDGLIDYILFAFGHASSPEAAAAVRTEKGDAWVADFMRSVPADVLTTLVPRAPSNYIDGHVLPSAGYEAIKAGNFHRVPIMLGSTRDETSYIAGVLAGFFNAKGGASDPLFWQQVNSDPTSLSVTDIIDPTLYPLYAPVHQTFSYAWNLAIDNVASQIRNNHGRVYRYDFNWDNVPAPWDEVFGATHTLDLPFLFGNFITDRDDFHRFAWTEDNKIEREELSDKFINYISNFIRTGHPTNGWANQPYWWPWHNHESFPLPKRLQLNADIKTSNTRFSYEEYTEQLNQLDPTAKSITESMVIALPGIE